MIDRITGKIVEKDPTHVVVESGGVGFFLNISVQTFEKIGRADSFTFFTHLNVREDLLQLFGFAEKAERKAFLSLVAVNGVGPKVAQAILSSMSVHTLKEAVVMGDWKRLTSAPGVGKKLGERMIVELKDKFGKETFGEAGTSVSIAGAAGVSSIFRDAVEALLALGFNPAQAEKQVSRGLALAGEDAPVEEVIRLALKQ
ncbi:Holliday junction branch migration protein RuvA [bacterium]|nr:Holliday junction branch migration protein RuvA [bacterium]